MAGRPVVWNNTLKKEAFESIIEQIAQGKSCRSILDNADRTKLPSFVTFCQWLKDDTELAKQYAYACEARADLIFEQLMDISDATEDDIIKDPITGNELVNHNVIQRDRLRVDTRKWILSKMNPKKYGEKVQNELTGDLAVTWKETKNYGPDGEANKGA